jgi:hypothetical protein
MELWHLLDAVLLAASGSRHEALSCMPDSPLLKPQLKSRPNRFSKTTSHKHMHLRSFSHRQT